MRRYSDRKKFPLEKVAVKVNFEGDSRTKIEVKIKLTGSKLTEEERASLLKVAGVCPVHKILSNSPTVVIEEEK